MTKGALEPEVVGRDAELATVRAFLAEVERLPAALVIEGEAGIGKTTLWRAGIAAAEELGYRVLSARPAEAESQVSYAGLRDLLDPVIERALVDLPPPQRRALEITLLLRDAEVGAPDQAAIAFAVLGAFGGIAGTPVLVAVDDVQWLDAASASVLAFAFRRLAAAPAAILVARRSGGREAAPLGLDRAFPSELLRWLRLGPLSVGATHRLLRERLGVSFPRPALVRLHETSGGNPFYALELGRALEQSGERCGRA